MLLWPVPLGRLQRLPFVPLLRYRVAVPATEKGPRRESAVVALPREAGEELPRLEACRSILRPRAHIGRVQPRRRRVGPGWFQVSSWPAPPLPRRPVPRCSGLHSVAVLVGTARQFLSTAFLVHPECALRSSRSPGRRGRSGSLSPGPRRWLVPVRDTTPRYGLPG